MTGYWNRHRLILTLVVTLLLAGVTGLLFVFPYIQKKAEAYNAQSVYRNTDIDFIVPEPSFEQTAELPGTNGIDKLFPFYLTKTRVKANGKELTKTVLLSDDFRNLEVTMYNQRRLIKKSEKEYDNSILVDWQFCHDTGSKIGDVVSISISGSEEEYQIYAIYETNTIYDGGAVLVQISNSQKEKIAQQSKNSGYSGAYISSSDYSLCRNFLLTDYRPLGRLKGRDQFETEEQYNLHYDAVMATGFANEITDFRIREQTLDSQPNSLLVWAGAALAMFVLLLFNVVSAARGCEKNYFSKHCIPKGIDVKPYYRTSFIFETLFTLAIYCGILLVTIKTSSIYIPTNCINWLVCVVPFFVVITEVINLRMNTVRIEKIERQIEKERKEKEEREKREKESLLIKDDADHQESSKDEESEAAIDTGKNPRVDGIY